CVPQARQRQSESPRAAGCARKLPSRLGLQPQPARFLEIPPAQFPSHLQTFRLASNASARGPLDTASSRDLPKGESNLSYPIPMACQSWLRPKSCIRPELCRSPVPSARVRPSSATSIPPQLFRWLAGRNFHHSLSPRLRLR